MDIRWDLYSSDDGVEWNMAMHSPATRYNRDENRYEVTVGGITDIYLKLVVTGWPAAFNIPVTEIAAYGSINGSDGRVSNKQNYTKYVTDLNLRYTPLADTRFTYSLILDDSSYNTGNDRNRLFQTGSVRWYHNKYFIPMATINYTLTTNSELADTEQRSYALTIQSSLLPTLDSSFGISRNENYEDDQLQYTNHTINFFNSATLYPNLDTTLDLSALYSSNSEFDTSSEAANLRWALTGRLWPTLLVDFIAEYGTNTLDLAEFTDDDSGGGRTTLNINWHPSDLVSVLANVSRGYGESWGNYQTFLVDGKFSILRTSRSQVILGFRTVTSDNDTNRSVSYNWSWNMSRYFTLQSVANYMLTEEDKIWGINTRLTARF